jgi:iron complex transport system substrate-binding protein
VALRVPVRRALLGEGRQIHAIAALEREAAFTRVVGWGEDLEKGDPDS